MCGLLLATEESGVAAYGREAFFASDLGGRGAFIVPYSRSLAHRAHALDGFRSLDSSIPFSNCLSIRLRINWIYSF